MNTTQPSQTLLDQFLVKLEALEQEALRDGLTYEAEGLRNMRVAIRWRQSKEGRESRER